MPGSISNLPWSHTTNQKTTLPLIITMLPLLRAVLTVKRFQVGFTSHWSSVHQNQLESHRFLHWKKIRLRRIEWGTEINGNLDWLDFLKISNYREEILKCNKSVYIDQESGLLEEILAELRFQKGVKRRHVHLYKGKEPFLNTTLSIISSTCYGIKTFSKLGSR